MKRYRSVAVALGALMLALTVSAGALAQDAEPAVATPGQDVKMMLLPKFLGILPFDQANQGAQEAAAELQNVTPFTYTGPTADNSVPARSTRDERSDRWLQGRHDVEQRGRPDRRRPPRPPRRQGPRS